MDNKPFLCSFLFFILLWFHLEVKFVNAAGEIIAEHRTLGRKPSEVSSGPVGEEGCPSCPVCINPVGDMDLTTLKIGIPVKRGFKEFVNVYIHPITKKKCVTGFSIDVFCAALQSSPLKLQPEFIPFENENGESAGTYDDLLSNISVKYEAVVGDVTIMVDRTSWVDFTMSYADSSIYALVPIRHDTRKNMWTFIKPLKWTLWLGILVSFIFVGIVIGIIEIRSNITNKDFSGRLPRRVGTMIWYPISMLVLPERRMVVSMWSILVLGVWLLVAFIIMQSYTANLTTMLTIDQLRPFFNKEGNFSVGHQEGSFVKEFLIQKMNYNTNCVSEYSTMKDYYKALSNGSVVAIFDELPYIKLFLREYGSEYTVFGPILRTNGFGFAFPLGSSLVRSFTRAIINVTDGRKMTEIEHKYFGRKQISEVEISRLPRATPSLDAYNFIGLFLVMGGISLLCLVCSEIWKPSAGEVNSTGNLSSTGEVNATGNLSPREVHATRNFPSTGEVNPTENLPSTGEVHATENLPIIANPDELPPTISNQNVELREEGEHEEEDDEIEEVHSS